MLTISVILTTYNSEKTLQRTLNSILHQEEINSVFLIELIVVDDCSTDSTIQILKENGVAYLSTHTNSGGPNAGRNIGLSRATGDFICIADHDDEWKLNRIKSLLTIADKTPIITSGYTLVDTLRGKSVSKVRNTDKTFTLYATNETFLKKLAKSQNCQQTYIGSLMYSAAFKHIQFEEEYGMGDYDFGLELLENNCSVEYTASLYTRYVVGNNLSLAESYRIKDYDKHLKTLEKYEARYPQHVKIARLRINGSLARYYYFMGKMSLARTYFLKSGLNFKNSMYYLTTFVGSKFVKKKFDFFR